MTPQVKALLTIEWICVPCTDYNEYTCSTQCNSWSPRTDRKHDTGCIVDEALTDAGLDTQAKRDEARRELGIK